MIADMTMAGRDNDGFLDGIGDLLDLDKPDKPDKPKPGDGGGTDSTPAAEGEVCVATSCAAGLTCSNFVCVSSDGSGSGSGTGTGWGSGSTVSGKGYEVGEACEFSAECTGQETCGGGSACSCARSLCSSGGHLESCSSSKSCLLGRKCVNFVCSGEAGDGCSSAGSCLDGLACVEGVCGTPPPGDTVACGGPCNRGTPGEECFQSGTCSGVGKCEYPALPSCTRGEGDGTSSPGRCSVSLTGHVYCKACSGSGCAPTPCYTPDTCTADGCTGTTLASMSSCSVFEVEGSCNGRVCDLCVGKCTATPPQCKKFSCEDGECFLTNAKDGLSCGSASACSAGLCKSACQVKFGSYCQNGAVCNVESTAVTSTREVNGATESKTDTVDTVSCTCTQGFTGQTCADEVAEEVGGGGSSSSGGGGGGSEEPKPVGPDDVAGPTKPPVVDKPVDEEPVGGSDGGGGAAGNGDGGGGTPASDGSTGAGNEELEGEVKPIGSVGGGGGGDGLTSGRKDGGSGGGGGSEDGGGSSSVGPIVGGAVGGIVVVACVVALLVHRRRSSDASYLKAESGPSVDMVENKGFEPSGGGGGGGGGDKMYASTQDESRTYESAQDATYAANKTYASAQDATYATAGGNKTYESVQDATYASAGKAEGAYDAPANATYAKAQN